VLSIGTADVLRLVGGALISVAPSFRRHVSAAKETMRVLAVGGLRDPQASAFYARLVAQAYDPNRRIDVLPEHRIIYVSVPKCASSRIKAILSASLGRHPRSVTEVHNRKTSGLQGPQQVGLLRFCEIATDATVLRFSFVRHPYDRLVSCWAYWFRDKPLIAGQPLIDPYLAWRQQHASSFPEGVDRTLSFAEFATFATATARDRIDTHWHLQADLIHMPGLTLDFVGKLESFANDFSRVLTHLRAGEALRRQALLPLNASNHEPWSQYYSQELADRVYCAYEPDFDQFRYQRAFV
jgi:Sulfotransferase family